jgi:hypothetical protein
MERDDAQELPRCGNNKAAVGELAPNTYIVHRQAKDITTGSLGSNDGWRCRAFCGCSFAGHCSR